MSNHSLDKLIPITKSYGRTKQNTDLRYSQKQEKFFVRDSTVQRLGLESKGFQLHVNPETKELFLTTHAHEDSRCVMFTKRPDSETKTNNFSAQKFADYLEEYGWLPEDVEQDLMMDLEDVGERGDDTYYKLIPKTGEQSEDIVEDTVETVTEDTEETGDMDEETEDVIHPTQEVDEPKRESI